MSGSRPAIELIGVSKHYGPVRAMDPTSLRIGRGETVAILGHSGGGKTTLLRLICGLEQPTSGSIETIFSAEHNPFPYGMVFQHPVLMPHLRVRENLAFGWRLHYNQWCKFWWEKTEPSELRQRLDEAIRLLELDSFQQRLPSELSGGQRQRVALGRCLVRRPAVFLLDEPLANLDPALASRLQQRLHDQFHAWGSTVLWVTHDPAEAALANRQITLTEGQMTRDSYRDHAEKRETHERT